MERMSKRKQRQAKRREEDYKHVHKIVPITPVEPEPPPVGELSHLLGTQPGETIDNLLRGKATQPKNGQNGHDRPKYRNKTGQNGASRIFGR